jgi:hypothetical protein
MSSLKLVIDECGYLDKLINQTDLFKNKDYLKENLLKPWLPILLEELLIPVFQSYTKEIGGTINAFYHRPQTFDLMKKLFLGLDVTKGEPFNEIFELKI